MALAVQLFSLENLLEWVLALSLAASGLCMLAVLLLTSAGRWQLANRRRERGRRRSTLPSDVRDLKARQEANPNPKP